MTVAIAKAREQEKRQRYFGNVEAADTIAALLDECERLMEDRARFPDRPDKVGLMIQSRYENLKARAEEAERLCHRAMDERDALARDAARYRWLRDVEWDSPDSVCWDEPRQHLDAAIDAAMKGASDE